MGVCTWSAHWLAATTLGVGCAPPSGHRTVRITTGSDSEDLDECGNFSQFIGDFRQYEKDLRINVSEKLRYCFFINYGTLGCMSTFKH